MIHAVRIRAAAARPAQRIIPHRRGEGKAPAECRQGHSLRGEE